MFRSSHFWFLVTFAKIQKYYVMFVYVLQDKMGKNGTKITQPKLAKYQKPKGENMGWTKHKNQMLNPKYQPKFFVSCHVISKREEGRLFLLFSNCHIWCLVFGLYLVTGLFNEKNIRYVQKKVIKPVLMTIIFPWIRL